MTQTDQHVVSINSTDTDLGYVATISVGADHIRTLTPADALAHAAAVLDAGQRAEYDACVVRQMTDRGSGIGVEATAMLVAELRADRPPLDEQALAPLGLDGGVNSKHEPFVAVSVHGKRVGQWTPADCRRHALAVLELVAAVDLDSAYLRSLRGVVGLSERVARNVVSDLVNYRPTWDVTR